MGEVVFISDKYVNGTRLRLEKGEDGDGQAVFEITGPASNRKTVLTRGELTVLRNTLDQLLGVTSEWAPAAEPPRSVPGPDAPWTAGLPAGPALVYVGTNGRVTSVDRYPISSTDDGTFADPHPWKRERALCVALLQLALELDAGEDRRC